MKLSAAVFVVAGCFFVITIVSMVAQWQSGQDISTLLKQDSVLRTEILTNQRRQLVALKGHGDRLSSIVAAQQRAAARLTLTEKALEKTRSDTEHQLLEIQHHVGSLPDAHGNTAFHSANSQVLVKADVVKAQIVTPSPIPPPVHVAAFVATPAATPTPTPTIRPPLPVFAVATRAPIIATPNPTASPTPSPNPCHTFLLGKVCR